jgi:hypothetical protein
MNLYKNYGRMTRDALAATRAELLAIVIQFGDAAAPNLGLK